LNEYLRADKPCIEALEKDDSPEAACNALSKMAMIYNINRNLANKKEETWRLETVHSLLRGVETPVTDDQVAKLVGDFSTKLGEAYPRESGTKPKLLSAATKFLWMRFKSPVVLYDRYARLCIMGADKAAYSDYLRKWWETFDVHKNQIAAACPEIIPFKRFTLAASMTDDEIQGLVEQTWFQERVFDHAIVDEGQRLEEASKAQSKR
jgi:hypothetical protein